MLLLLGSENSPEHRTVNSDVFEHRETTGGIFALETEYVMKVSTLRKRNAFWEKSSPSLFAVLICQGIACLLFSLSLGEGTHVSEQVEAAPLGISVPLYFSLF